jgi:hypothetical protein
MPPSSVGQALHDARQAQRRREIYRALKRQLPIRLTAAQRIVLSRAADMTWRAEIAMASADVTANDLVRLDRVAASARNAWAQLVRAHKPPPRSLTPTLSELLNHG